MKKFFLAIYCFLMVGCTTVPSSIRDEDRKAYGVKINNKDFQYDPMKTQIGKVYQDKLKDKEISGASLIEDGLAAFVIRASFARNAEKTIDLQTYIYSNDFSSRVLIKELYKAAKRGVKVRILLDDNGTDADIVDVMLLNMHPNIEVRVFNTFKYRGSFVKYPQFLFDFNRLNSRMHNKLFIVDGVSVIIGGRNIGSNYFYPENDSNFSDTDVLFLGSIAKEASKSFNDYWDHHLAIPASAFPDNNSEKRILKLQKKFALLEIESQEDYDRYNDIITYAQQAYLDKKFKFYWGRGKILVDPPEKIDLSMCEKKSYNGPITSALQYLWDCTQDSIHISAAYFVPGQEGLERLIDEEKKGVDVLVVTNSLSSTDASVVYANWEKYRSELIKNDVQVYEFMNCGINLAKSKKEKDKKLSSFSALHSKTIVFDDTISWIGSFNLDPRSAYFNTEIVAIFYNKEFATELKKMIKDDTKTAWHVTEDKCHTVWTGTRPEDTTPSVYTTEPDTTFWQRVINFMLKIVPEDLV